LKWREEAETLAKKELEIVHILEAFDLTRCPWSAARLAGCDPKTVQHYVARRDAGRDPLQPGRRPHLIDPFLGKVEELVERSCGKIRADVVHDRLVAMGFGGDERTTRRAVAEVKTSYQAGRHRVYRPWIPEPGMWLQYDWSQGPLVGGRPTNLFCAWLAWSRHRVVLPTWDRTLGTVLTSLDATFRRLGGVPTYALTDNERTVTMDRVAGVPIRHPELVAAGRHYGVQMLTCTPADPETKGGSEATVRIAQADLVPTEANLLESYNSFGGLVEACDLFCNVVNSRPHRETHRTPRDVLADERKHLHVLPAEPYTAALGETRTVDRRDRTIRFGSVRYSTPPGYESKEVWCRVDGEELVIVGRGERGLSEIVRHRLSVPGRPVILDEHYPDHPNGNGVKQPAIRPKQPEEEAFLAIGEGAEQWLREAGAAGVTRIRAKMAEACQLATLFSRGQVSYALARAAIAKRFGEGDLASILGHLQRGVADGEKARADEAFSTQQGTGAWESFGL